MDLFKDIFSWLPLYSYVDTGKQKLIIMHGGISDKINLKKINTLTRNRCKIIDHKDILIMNFSVIDISIEVAPQSKTGGKRLTEDEDNEYHQMQGKKFEYKKNS